MKWAFRNKTAEERLKMAIFKLSALSYMLTTLYISFFFIRTTLPSSMLCENIRKSLNQQIWVWHILNYGYFLTFQTWG